jgi:hypothetical protein
MSLGTLITFFGNKTGTVQKKWHHETVAREDNTLSPKSFERLHRIKGGEAALGGHPNTAVELAARVTRPRAELLPGRQARPLEVGRVDERPRPPEHAPGDDAEATLARARATAVHRIREVKASS